MRKFALFPNSVARDPRLTPAALVYLAVRAMFTGDYDLNPSRLGHLFRRGFGRDAVEAAQRCCKAAGYLKRWQPPPAADGKFQRASELLALPDIPRNKSKIVFATWFNGELSVAEFAALLYLRAGTGKGPAHTAEVATRFAWDTKTAHKHMRALRSRKVLEPTARRDAASKTFAGTTYKVPRLGKGALAPSRLSSAVVAATRPQPSSRSGGPEGKSQGTVSQGTVFQGTTLNTSCISSPRLTTSESLPTLSKYSEQYTVRAAREPVPTISNYDLSKLHQEAHDAETLLGWIFTDGSNPAEAVFDDGACAEDALADVWRTLPDAELVKAVKRACGGRVAQEIISPAGLYAIRWLSAFLVDKAEDEDEHVTAAEALAMLLKAMEDRIGTRPGQWLNSIGLIGKRLAADRYTGFVGEQLYRPERTRAPDKAIDPRMQALIDADAASALSPKLRRDPAGYQQFVLQQTAQHHVDPKDVEEIIASTLRRGLLDPKEPGSIRAWVYFSDPIAEEIHRRRVSTEGLRPGDALGAARWRKSHAAD